MRTSGSADSRIEKMCSGPARKSSIALFWIATVEYSRQRRCLRVAFMWLANQAAKSLPSQCMAATTNRLRRWKYACQSMASSLSLHAMCQIAAPGSVTVG